ncbi:MAG: isochorismate synthase [Myxococcales bacterium]|nr:isochorismate synthase [Myxococcales bacterium]
MTCTPRLWAPRQSVVAATSVCVFPAPIVDANTLLSLQPESLSFFWESQNLCITGFGVAVPVSGYGQQRFAQVAKNSSQLWAALRVVKQPDVPSALGPVIVGGAAFSPGSARISRPQARGKSGLTYSPMAALGDAFFVLPETGYITDGRHAAVWAVTNGPRLDEKVDLNWLQTLLSRQDHGSTLRQMGYWQPEERVAVFDSPGDIHVWEKAVHAVLDAISAGSIDKVVLARSCTVRLPLSMSPTNLALALGPPSEGETRFLFRPCPGMSIVGKSPERLVSLNDRNVHTEAVAGTRPSAEPAENLLSSQKDRYEHQLVVSGLTASLRPLCDSIDVQNESSIRKTGPVQHLTTAVWGTTSARCHVLNLVDVLHPSPALCGTPRDAALSWIDHLEPQPRGWYGGPIGWMDADGNGDFSVMIRSAFLEAGQARLYAGAGIVAGSVPTAEYAETETKFALMRGVLCREV